ncbi:ACP S-malonyltransferase [Latilactobacillus sakei]|uniref:ACP S-malonyltransferase n=1 Tax=Latilactobacillus sakei TaxID=1599 RepID=UPI00202EAD04|nr:ACP S-malonyltransferase [Latilactobacillus sakei]MCM1635772.1 ACP S-malonyltransferase [Latilactobacillus sakei]
METVGILFDGQGSQYYEMGKSLYNECELVRPFYKQLSRELHLSLDSLFELKEDKIKQTIFSQPLIFTFEVSLYSIFKSKYPKLAVQSYGLSLGMYSAMYANNYLDFSQLLKIVIKRAECMQKASEVCPGKMIALSNGNIDDIEFVCSQLKNEKVSVANYNSTKQVVVGGSHMGVNKASKLFDALGIQQRELQVNGAFHTALMDIARVEFLQFLNDKFNSLPGCSNKISLDTSIEKYRKKAIELCANQIVSATSLVDVLAHMEKLGINRFVEIGPKIIISRFITDCLDNKQVDTITSYQDIKELSFQ